MNKNAKHALYTPLTLVEQDLLTRLTSAQEVYVEVVGWGYHSNPTVTSGDKRLQVSFPLQFTAPKVVMPVSSFHLRLKLRDGSVLYEEEKRLPHALPIQEGVCLHMIWDIAFSALPDAFLERMGARRGGGEGVTTLARVQPQS